MLPAPVDLGPGGEQNFGRIDVTTLDGRDQRRPVGA